MRKNWRYFEKGEIATIITIGTLIFLGVSTLTSSLLLKNKQTSSAKAACASNQCTGSNKCYNVGEGAGGSYCCYRKYSYPTWGNEQCSLSPTLILPTNSIVTSKPTSIYTAKCNPGFHFCPSNITECCEDVSTPTITSAILPTASTISADCSAAYSHACCVRDTYTCSAELKNSALTDDNIRRVRWYGCTGRPCDETKINNKGIGGDGNLVECSKYPPYNVSKTNQIVDTCKTASTVTSSPTPIPGKCEVKSCASVVYNKANKYRDYSQIAYLDSIVYYKNSNCTGNLFYKEDIVDYCNGVDSLAISPTTISILPTTVSPALTAIPIITAKICTYQNGPNNVVCEDRVVTPTLIPTMSTSECLRQSDCDSKKKNGGCTSDSCNLYCGLFGRLCIFPTSTLPSSTPIPTAVPSTVILTQPIVPTTVVEGNYFQIVNNCDNAIKVVLWKNNNESFQKVDSLSSKGIETFSCDLNVNYDICTFNTNGGSNDDGNNKDTHVCNASYIKYIISGNKCP